MQQTFFRTVGQVHLYSVLCGLSALSLNTNAPKVLQAEAIRYQDEAGVSLLGSEIKVKPEKAVLANCAAVREWDANGTVFGFSERNEAHRAGEFGHNDYYPVALAAAQLQGLDGQQALKGMLLIDEIRGRLCEVFSLKSYKIDHVVHGGIASAATFGAMLGASPEQIEKAIGMLIAHYIPFRAIRAGKQLSDSKGASAAITAEIAVMSMIRAMNGFQGPRDIFRNPEAIFRLNERTTGDSPFELNFADEGLDFAIMGMHFKLGLYEHQAAGAIAALISLLQSNKSILKHDIDKITIISYEPAFSIIGNPEKRDPTTRQSADHSMVYIISRLLDKAYSLGDDIDLSSQQNLWSQLMLSPLDYSMDYIMSPKTRAFFPKIVFEHGGPQFDKRYPEGIPTIMMIEYNGKTVESELVMFPPGHARNFGDISKSLLFYKFQMLGTFALDEPESYIRKLQRFEKLNSNEVKSIYCAPLKKLDIVIQ